MEEEDNVITQEDSYILAICKMAQGNPGAVTVMAQLLKKDQTNGILAMMHLDDMKIRGWKIWVCFKDYCNQDINRFYDLVMSRDKELCKFISCQEEGIIRG